MNNDGLEQDCTSARLLKVLSILLTPALVLVFLLCRLSWNTQAKLPRQTGGNLVPNWGFETPPPTSWHNEEENLLCEYSWPGNNAYEGAASAGILGKVGGYTCRWWCDCFPVDSGRRYHFSGVISPSNVLDKAFVTLAFYSSPSQQTPIEEVPSSQVDGSNDWMTVTGSAVAPSGAHCARVYCKLRGQGTARFDGVSVHLVGTPTLEITKTDDPDPVEPGQSLIYTINYSNTGEGPATEVVITETYDANVRFNDADPTPEPDSGNRVWKIGTLIPGEGNSIVITAMVSSDVIGGPTLTNLVKMVCSGTDSVSATATTVVSTTAVTKTVYLPFLLRDFHSLCNGGFETGDFMCWAHGGGLGESVQCGIGIAYKSDCAALLGNPDYLCVNGVPIAEVWIKQKFSVPSYCSPTLSFKYNIFSEDKLVSWSDSFDVFIDNTRILSDGNKFRKESCDIPAWNAGWKDFSYDLNVYQGQNIYVSFHNANREDQWYNTWTYVDQVEVICKP